MKILYSILLKNFSHFIEDNMNNFVEILDEINEVGKNIIVVWG